MDTVYVDHNMAFRALWLIIWISAAFGAKKWHKDLSTRWYSPANVAGAFVYGVFSACWATLAALVLCGWLYFFGYTVSFS